MKAVRLVTSLWCHLSSPLITSVRWNMGARLTHCSDGGERARDDPGEDVATRAGAPHTRGTDAKNGNIGGSAKNGHAVAHAHVICLLD